MLRVHTITLLHIYVQTMKAICLLTTLAIIAPEAESTPYTTVPSQSVGKEGIYIIRFDAAFAVSMFNCTQEKYCYV